MTLDAAEFVISPRGREALAFIAIHGGDALFLQEIEVGRGHEGALARHGVDEAFALQLVIRPLGGDDADLEVLGQLADGGQRLALLQVARKDLGPHLPQDLLVDGVGRGVGKEDAHGGPTVYIEYIR